MADLVFNDFAFPATGAPTNRSLPDRLKEIINVKDFGAVGDGVTDDREAIQDAINWRSELLTTTRHHYSGAFRVASSSWSGGTLTLHLTEPHGWAGPTALIRLEHFSSSGGTVPGGNYTATIIDTDTITVPASAPGPSTQQGLVGYHGLVRPQITGAEWVANLVTLTFAEAHRLETGVACLVSGFAPSDLNNASRTVTKTGAATLTFPLTGSGTVTTNGTCRPTSVLYVDSVPSTVSGSTNSYLAARFPTTDAATFGHSVTSVTSTTLTLSPTFALCADIPDATEVRIGQANRGTIFFPPGVYRVDGPLYYDDTSITSRLLGVPGKSIIRAGEAGVGFDGYILNQNLKVGQTGPSMFEKLTFINEHETGGGMQLTCVTAQVKDCTFEANQCLNFTSDDWLNAITFSAVLNNCTFSPGTHTSGSIGVMVAVNNGTITGNYVAGFDEGFRMINFGKTILGNVFENNGIGINSGINPTGGIYTSDYSVLGGNAFINNGIGYLLNGSGGKSRFEGNYIEGGPDATYGFRKLSDSQINLVRGLEIAGDFATYGFSAVGGSAGTRWNSVRGVRVVNDSGTAWEPSVTAHSGSFIGCNDARLHTYSQLNGRAVASAAWSSGTATITTHAAHGLTGGFNVHISSVQVSGSTANSYNGVFTATAPTSTTIQYTLPDDPGGSGDANTGSAQGGSSARSERPIKTGLSWAGGVVSAETWGDHRIAPGTTLEILLVTVGGSTTNGYNGEFTKDKVTVTGPTTFTYTVAGDPGTPDASSLAASTATARSLKGTARAPRMLGSNFSTAIGSTRSITDGAKLGGGTAAIGDLVQGGGPQRIKVVWTATGWARVG